VTRKSGLLSLVSLALTGAIVGLLVVGCGIRPTGVIPGQDAPTGAITSMIVYLLDHGTLRAVARPLPQTQTANPDGTNKITPYVGPEQQALNALIQGPTATEAAAGMSSEVPTSVFGVIARTEGNVAEVYVKAPDDGQLTKNAVDQIACTVITAHGVNSYSDNKDVKFQVVVIDSNSRPRPAQGCPLDTP
jgi:hypothetical protein